MNTDAKGIEYIVADPSGNITVLITSSYENNAERARMIEEAFCLEADCEQAGFVETISPGHVRLEMMGYEFCGNASLSASSWQAYKDGLAAGEKTVIDLDSSGVDGTLRVTVHRLDDITPCGADQICPQFIGNVMMPLPQIGMFRNHPVIHMNGISHILAGESELTDDEARTMIKGFAAELDVPALGIILCNMPPSEFPVSADDASVSIRPLVYVRETDTLVWEHGCATGSTAVGYYRYIQSLNGSCSDTLPDPSSDRSDSEHPDDLANFTTDVFQPGGLISISIKKGRPELTGTVILRKYQP